MAFLIRLFLFATFLFPSLLWGTMVLPLNLSQMTEQAEKIFVGRCLESEAELDENRLPATYTRFEVLDGIKGVRTGEEFLMKSYGVEREPLYLSAGEKAIVPLKSMRISGARFRPNGEYLLFLYPESRLGFTSPVGAGQGKFWVITDDQGVRSVLNPLDNRFLYGRGDSRIAPMEFPGGPITLDKMVETVQKLMIHE